MSDTMLKDMLLLLSASLQADMMHYMHQSKLELQELGDQVDNAECSMCNFTANYNTHTQLNLKISPESKQNLQI